MTHMWYLRVNMCVCPLGKTRPRTGPFQFGDKGCSEGLAEINGKWSGFKHLYLDTENCLIILDKIRGK